MFSKVKNNGALHLKLGVPVDQPIPDALLQAAESSSDPKLRKSAIWAESRKHAKTDRYKIRAGVK